MHTHVQCAWGDKDVHSSTVAAKEREPNEGFVSQTKASRSSFRWVHFKSLLVGTDGGTGLANGHNGLGTWFAMVWTAAGAGSACGAVVVGNESGQPVCHRSTPNSGVLRRLTGLLDMYEEPRSGRGTLPAAWHHMLTVQRAGLVLGAAEAAVQAAVAQSGC